MSERVLRERLGRLDLEQKARLLTGADFWALHEEPAAGLRRIVTSDGPAGVRGERWDEREPSANVPSPTALAATWDEARIERLGRLLAAEARRKGVHVVLAPMVNLHRTPYGGRHFECFSEDPLLTGRIGAAYVRGLQAEGVAATVKHFVANDSETERFTLDARVGERALRELYLAPFEALVREAGAWTVMAAYNGVNGATMTESPMLRDVLHGEWGFDGLVMSDWGAARDTEAAGNAALDLVMPGPAGPWGDALVRAVREGRVSEAAVDDKVLRLLRLAARVGALDGAPRGEAPGAPHGETPGAPHDEAPGAPHGEAPSAPPGTPPAASPGEAPGGSPARAWPPDAVAAELRSTAAAGFVLARNEGPLLPLDRRSLRRVAVLGPAAATARTLGGGSATVFPPYAVTPLDGIRAALGDAVEIAHAAGVRAGTRIPPAPLPDGAQVRFLDRDGAVLASEHRRTSSFTWLGAFGPDLPIDRVAAVEVRARLRPASGGEHVLGCSGVGRFRLEVAGEELFSRRIEPSPGADIGEAVLRPPQHAVPIAVEREVELVLRHDLDEDARTVAFQLNAEPPQPPPDEELERAVALARGADVAVVVVGTTEEDECEGVDRDSLALPGRQDELVRRVAGANPRTVVVVNAGSPVLLPWAGDVAAVLLAWFPGQEFGHALADVLLGAAEPGGRLPTTWPAAEAGLPSTRPVAGVLRYDEGIFAGYRGYDRDGREPLFPFGHGLGYTDWEYLALEAERPAGGGATVLVRLRNAGPRPGREVVQVYLSRPGSAVERPPRWLGGFAVVEAAAGEELTVEVHVAARAFEHWNGGWVEEAGGFVVEAGRSSRDLRLSGRV